MSADWSAPTDPETAARRAGGRRRWNQVRQLQARERQHMIAEVARRLGADFHTRGVQSRLAEGLGVNRSTICRDVAALLGRAQRWQPCPRCDGDGIVPRDGAA